MDAIHLRGVKTHNLKNLELVLKHRKLYAVTGVSGSGKSSLAFDTLYAEGQRRFVESLSAYARQFLERMEKPDIESASGLPPAIAIEAKNVISNARSTVGTQTEINDYLRVLFSRVAKTFCPDCGREVVHYAPDTAAERLLKDYPGRQAVVGFEAAFEDKAKTRAADVAELLEKQGFSEFFCGGVFLGAGDVARKRGVRSPLMVCVDRLKLDGRNRKRLTDSLETAFRYGRGEAVTAFESSSGGKGPRFSEHLRCASCARTFRDPVPNLFSFNSPLGACPECQGFGRIITLDWDLVVPDPKRSLAGGAIEPWTKPSAAWEARKLTSFCRRRKISMETPWRDLSEEERRMILEGPRDPDGDYFSVRDFFEYLEKKTYKMHVRIFLSKYRKFVPCHACHETRLKPEALYVRWAGKTIHDYQKASLTELAALLDGAELSAPERARCEPVYLEIKRRVRFLNEVGLGYLSLSRLSRTLSGGEVQRIHLATSLGSALVDTLYVLDEPSVGLHERDNRLLIRLLRELRDLGNTVVVVEHDRTLIEAADEVIDLGPGGGRGGGEILFQGEVAALKKCGRSLTGQYLSGKLQIERRREAGHIQEAPERWIRIRGACANNLKNIDVDLPLGRLAVITGVSGSGKSTLLYDILYSRYLKFSGRPVQDPGAVRAVEGLEAVDEMVLVDQSAIARTPRSNAVTYLKAFEDIRSLFAATASAKREGLTAGHFSFNVDGGRCEVCKGDGRLKVEMHFLADVFVPCEACRGRRFKPEILEVKYRGKNIDDVLALTADEAWEFFEESPKLRSKLEWLRKVGLGYLCLGQSATTFSGGEAQRLKLACEMAEKRGRSVLYLFDEPTTGLHQHEIGYLMRALDELLAQGHSAAVIEHNMEVIRSADYVIDLGPEGGEGGGRVVYQGPIEGITKVKESYTGQFLLRRWSLT